MRAKYNLILTLLLALYISNVFADTNCSSIKSHPAITKVKPATKSESNAINIINYNINQAAIISATKKDKNKSNEIKTTYAKTICHVAISIIILLFLRYISPLLLRYIPLLWRGKKKQIEPSTEAKPNPNTINTGKFASQHIAELVKFLKENDLQYTGSFNAVISEANSLLNQNNDNQPLDPYTLEFSPEYINNLKKQLLNNTSFYSLFGARSVDIEYYAYLLQYLYSACSNVNQAQHTLPLSKKGSSSQLFSWAYYLKLDNTKVINNGENELPPQSELKQVKYEFSFDKLNHPIIELTATIVGDNKINYCLDNIHGVKFSILTTLWSRLVSQYKFVFMLPLLLIIITLGLTNIFGLDYDFNYLKLSIFSDHIFHYLSWWLVGVLLIFAWISYPLIKWIVKSRKKVFAFQAKINSLPADALDFTYTDVPIFHPLADRLNFTQVARSIYYGYIFDRFFPNKARFILLDAGKGMGKTSILNLLESKAAYCTPDLFVRQARNNYLTSINQSFYPVFRQQAKQEELVFIWISILEIADVLQASSFKADALIKLIAKKAPTKYANVFLQLIEDVEVSAGWFKMKLSGFNKIDNFIKSKIILVIEDIDRKTDLFLDVFQDLALLQSIPNLIVILPFLKADLFYELERLKGENYNIELNINNKEHAYKLSNETHEESSKSRQDFRALYNKLIDSEFDFGKHAYFALANLFIQKILSKGFFGRLNIENGDDYIEENYEVTPVDNQVKLTNDQKKGLINWREDQLEAILKYHYFIPYLNALFNQLKLDIRTFKKIFALAIKKIEYGNYANFIPDLFIDVFILVSHYQEGEKKTLAEYRQIFASDKNSFPEVKYYFYALQEGKKEEMPRQELINQGRIDTENLLELENNLYYDFCSGIARLNYGLFNDLFAKVPQMLREQLGGSEQYSEFQNALCDWLFWIYNPLVNNAVDDSNVDNSIYMMGKLELLTTPNCRSLVAHSGNHITQFINHIQSSQRFKRVLEGWNEMLKSIYNLNEDAMQPKFTKFINDIPRESKRIFLNFSYLTLAYYEIIKTANVPEAEKIYLTIADKIITLYGKEDDKKTILEFIKSR